MLPFGLKRAPKRSSICLETGLRSSAEICCGRIAQPNLQTPSIRKQPMPHRPSNLGCEAIAAGWSSFARERNRELCRLIAETADRNARAPIASSGPISIPLNPAVGGRSSLRMSTAGRTPAKHPQSFGGAMFVSVDDAVPASIGFFIDLAALRVSIEPGDRAADSFDERHGCAVVG